MTFALVGAYGVRASFVRTLSAFGANVSANVFLVTFALVGTYGVRASFVRTLSAFGANVSANMGGRLASAARTAG